MKKIYLQGCTTLLLIFLTFYNSYAIPSHLGIDDIFNPTVFEFAVANYSRFRDYSNTGILSAFIGIFPRLIILHTVAEFSNVSFILTTNINATIVDKEFCYSKLKSYSPTTGVATAGFWKVPCTPTNLASAFSGTLSKAYLIQITSDEWAFATCDTLKKENYSIWQFSLFTDPFDKISWTMLVISFVFVAIMSPKGAFMSTLSSMLLLGAHALSKRSCLFVVWMVACTVIGTFYTGTIQSTLIKPLNDDVAKTFGDLKERNYTLAIPESAKTIKTQFKLLSNFTNSSISKTRENLNWLLERAQVVADADVYQRMATKKGKWASVGPWYLSHLYAWLHPLLLDINSTLNPVEVNSRRCYVGQEFINSDVEFYVFNPPGTEIVAAVFQRLIYAGIVQRWEEEGHALIHSGRVQDRVRVKSPRIIRNLEMRVIESLRMEGKTLTIFLFYGMCILMCLVGLGLEMFVFYYDVIVDFLWESNHVKRIRKNNFRRFKIIIF